MSRKRMIASIIFALILVVGLCSSVRAYYNAISPSFASPRIIAIGGAYVAVADDASAVFLNPARLGNLDYRNFSASYGSLLGNMKQYSFMGSTSLGKYGGLGIGYNTSGYYDEPVYVRDGSTGNIIGLTKSTFQTGDFAISYGYPVFEWFLVGVKGHKLSQELRSTVIYSSSEVIPLSDYEANGEGYGLDMGLLLKPFQSLFIGLLIENIYATDFNWGGGLQEKIVKENILGLSYQLIEDNVLLAMDLRGNALSDIDTVSIGSELGYIKRVKLRFGCMFAKDANSNYLGTPSVGMGFSFFENLQFDYAWVRPNRIIYDSHYFSLGCKF